MILQEQGAPNALYRSSILAALGTIVLVGIGLAIRAGLAESVLVGLALVIVAVVASAISPASGVASVLLAAPTMYDLYPLPRGTFSLLEIATLTATAGISLRLLVDAMRNGWARFGDLLRPAHVVVPIGMLLAATVLSLVTLADPGYRAESLREVRTVIIEPLMFFAVAKLAMREEATRRFAGWALMLAGALVASYAVAQIALDLGGVAAGSITRATATYTHPNNLALFLERTVLVTVGVGIVRPRWWPVWLLAMVQLTGLALTFSRGALIAMAVGVAAVLLLRGMMKWLLLLLAGGVGVAGLGVVLFPERFVDAGGSGAEPTRFTIWRASWRMILDHPLFGVGPDQFLYQYSRRYIEPMGWPERYTSHPHNLVLDVWLRLGAMGLAAAATLVVGVMWWTRRWFGFIRNDPWSMGASAALVGGVAHGMVDNGFFLPDLATLTWFFVVMIVTVPNQWRDEVKADRPDRIASSWPEPPGRDDSRDAERRPAVGILRLVAIAVTTIMLAVALWPNPYLPFLFTATVGFVTILNPAVGIAVVLMTIPVQDAYLVPFVRGDLTYTQIALFGLVLGWLVTALRQRLWLDGIVAGFAAVFAAYAVSLAEMDDPALWAGEVYRWTAAAVVYLISRAVLSTWSDVRIVLYGVVAGIIVAALTVVDQLQEQASSAAGLSMGSFRAMGAFGVPNPLAAYVELGVPVLLVLSLFGLRPSVRARLGTGFWAMTMLGSALGLAILALTQSRGGFIGFGAAIIAIFFILPGRLKSATLISGVVLVTAFTLTPVGQSQLDRFANVLEENRAPVENVHQGTLGRESLWIAGVRMIEDEPLTGIGAGEYDYHYREYVPNWVDRFPRGQAHNGWLQMGAQAGVPGIIAFSIWLAASLAALWGAARRSTDELARLLAWGGFAVMLAFSIHSLVDYLNVLSLGIQLSAVTAIGLSLAPDPLRTVKRWPSVRLAADDTYSATVTAR